MRNRVVVLGKGELAIDVVRILLADSRYQIKCVVPCVPEPGWSDSLIGFCKQRSVTLLESGNYEDIKFEGPNDQIDILISVYYDKVIKEGFLKRCGKTMNIHNSPLPRYRGMYPINWALENGEREHGVTIHEIVPKVDSGNIISQVKFSIYPEFEDVKSVYKRCIRFGYHLFQETLVLMNKISSNPQNETEATLYRKESLKDLVRFKPERWED